MNRQERRQREREIAKHSQTINSLNSRQIALVDAMVNERVAFEKSKINKDVILYCSYALTKNYIEEAVIIDAIEDVAALIKEDNPNKVEKEFVEMLKNREQVMKYFEENKGKSRKELIKEASYKFPMLAKNSIAKYCDEFRKANLSAEAEEEEDPDVIEAMEKIADIIGDDPVEEKKVAEEIIKEADKVTTEAESAIVEVKQEEVKCQDGVCTIPEPKEVVKKKLKVKTMTIEGENGLYVVDSQGVTLKKDGGTLSFDSLQQFEEFIEEFREVFTMVC
ncbi:hypothetical protein [Clostridium thermarum]|uniref:hypothetical protein n=1 Tax=Clostridium thermarum TaxID=1716543 RepID=UPI0011209B42|nr:hypothetical protein [Clostridium thermarum]